MSDLLGKSLPLKKIQLWPKKVEACVADKSALLTNAQRQNCLTYFIGFQVDKHRMRGDQLNVEIPLHNFRDWDLSRFQPLITGCDILVKHFKVKELPTICFEGIYDGGKTAAMQKRRQSHDTDPARIERKKLARLVELKAKMAEIQRKKEEQQDKKRKRNIDREEEEVKNAVDEEELTRQSSEIENVGIEDDETDLLANALDTVQESGDIITREEAEADKEKLLSGEMLVESENVDADGYESENENVVGYTKDDARQVILQKSNNEGGSDGEKHKDKRSLPISDEMTEFLSKHGYYVVSDDEAVILGANLLPPWRHKANTDQDIVPSHFKISFREKFDLVELDALGYVIDKGDDDFVPSKTWVGRKAGFEFKVGERGLGYYRTGRTVVVPSNTTY